MGGLGENGYMCMYGWVPLLFAWNYNIVNRLCCLCLVTQLCPTLCDPMDCNLPGSSVHGILQQEYWNGLPFSPPGDLRDPGTEPGSPALQMNSLLSETPGKNKNTGAGRVSLLQGILLTQESNRGLHHCSRIFDQLSYQGSPLISYTPIQNKKFKVWKIINIR